MSGRFKGGTNLDSIFEPRDGRGSAQSTGHFVGNQDLGDRYLAKSEGGGATAQATGIYVGNNDLNQLFTKLGDTPQAIDWVNKGNNGGNSLSNTSLTYTGNSWVYTKSGRTYRSVDFGSSWTSLSVSSGSLIKIASNGSGDVVVVGNSGGYPNPLTSFIATSNDHGVSFTEDSLDTPTDENFYGVDTDGNGTWWAVTGGGLVYRKTTNSPTTWTYFGTVSNRANDLCYSNGNIIIVDLDGGIRTYDSNLSFISFKSGNEEVRVVTSGRNGIVLSQEINSTAGVKSFDNGASWATHQHPLTTSFYDIATDSAGTWIACANGVVFRTTDNGSSINDWTVLPQFSYDANNMFYTSATDGNGRWMILSVIGNTPVVWTSG